MTPEERSLRIMLMYRRSHYEGMEKDLEANISKEITLAEQEAYAKGMADSDKQWAAMTDRKVKEAYERGLLRCNPRIMKP